MTDLVQRLAQLIWDFLMRPIPTWVVIFVFPMITESLKALFRWVTKP